MHNMKREKPLVAITMGDPSGIGPEIVCKGIVDNKNLTDKVRFLIIGDLKVMQNAAIISHTCLKFRLIDNIDRANAVYPEIDVFCPDGVKVGAYEIGKLNTDLGLASGLCIKQMAEFAKKGQIDGMVSAPINKEAFHRAGFNYRDELAFMGEVTESPEVFISGAVNSLWTITIAEHVPFREIIGLVEKERILSRIRLLNEYLKKAGVEKPHLAVAALNVHAGDGGLFGMEEIDEINPAIELAQKEGIDAIGSIAADSVFIGAFDGKYDGVVCMYHDQANIARKLQPKECGCTLFLGLPVMCGTTAHGTAFDIAGKGIANAGSLATAIRWTSKFAINS